MFERDKKGQFLKGSGGRPQGARNKLQATFVDALEKDFTEHGAGVINIVRIEKPADYLKIVASILPKEFVLTEGELENLSDEELLEALTLIREAKAARESVQ
jgi:hypothetical protein